MLGGVVDVEEVDNGAKACSQKVENGEIREKSTVLVHESVKVVKRSGCYITSILQGVLEKVLDIAELLSKPRVLFFEGFPGLFAGFTDIAETRQELFAVGTRVRYLVKRVG